MASFLPGSASEGSALGSRSQSQSPEHHNSLEKVHPVAEEPEGAAQDDGAYTPPLPEPKAGAAPNTSDAAPLDETDTAAAGAEEGIEPSVKRKLSHPAHSLATAMENDANARRKSVLQKFITRTNLMVQLAHLSAQNRVPKVHPLGETLDEPIRVHLAIVDKEGLEEQKERQMSAKRNGEKSPDAERKKSNREFEEIDQQASTTLKKTPSKVQQNNSSTSSGSITNMSLASANRLLSSTESTLGDSVAATTAAAAEEEEAKLGCVKAFLSKLVMRPDSVLRVRWDLVQATFLIYLSFVVPYRVGLKVPAKGGYFVFEFLIDMYFWVDILLNFFTGFYQEDGTGYLVMDIVEVRNNYLKGWFALDIVACLPIGMITDIMEGTFSCSFTGNCPDVVDEETNEDVQLLKLLRLLRVVRLVKLLRLVRISRLFERYQDDLFKLLPVISIVKLIFVLLYLGHLFGCFFYFFSSWEFLSKSERQQMRNGDLMTWQVKEFYSADPVVQAANGVSTIDKYIASMYWAFTTMTTVGYGDIFATTLPERFFAIIGMIAGGFVFSGIIGTMSEVMRNSDLSKRAHGLKMEEVLAFLRDERLPRHLAKPAIAFFRKQDIKGYSGTELLESLPFQLRFHLMKHKFYEAVKHVPFFDRDGDGKLDDPVFFTEMCMCLNPVRYQQRTFVYEHGEISKTMYIVIKGAVYLLDKTRTFALARLAKGSFFGEGAIIGQKQRLENILAGNCEIAMLDKERLMRLLPNYPHIKMILKDTYIHRVQEYMKLGAIDPESEVLTDLRLRAIPVKSTTTNGVDDTHYELQRLSDKEYEEMSGATRAMQDPSFRHASALLQENDHDPAKAMKELRDQVQSLQSDMKVIMQKLDSLISR